MNSGASDSGPSNAKSRPSTGGALTMAIANSELVEREIRIDAPPPAAHPSRPPIRYARLARARVELRPATPRRGCRRAGSRPGPVALDRARHANGGPLAAAPLLLPARATAAAIAEVAPVPELIATTPATRAYEQFGARCGLKDPSACRSSR